MRLIELSTVLWDMTLKTVLGMSGVVGAIALVVAFSLWFSLTIGILLLMEGLSAFLHALRLHWCVIKYFESFSLLSSFSTVIFANICITYLLGLNLMASST